MDFTWSFRFKKSAGQNWHGRDPHEMGEEAVKVLLVLLVLLLLLQFQQFQLLLLLLLLLLPRLTQVHLAGQVH